MPASTKWHQETGSRESWRDWVDHAVMLSVLWPRLLDPLTLPPAALLALLGTCTHTRDRVLQQVPHIKLTLHTRSQAPFEANPVLLLHTSGRTLPTTLTLIPSPCPNHQLQSPQPSPPINQVNPTTNCILQQLWMSQISALTTLELHETILDMPTLDAIRSLPSLNHLILQNPFTVLDCSQFQPYHLPQRLRTVHIRFDHKHNWFSPTLMPLESFLAQLLALDNVTGLTLDMPGTWAGEVINSAFKTLLQGKKDAHPTRALQCLSIPASTLYDFMAATLRQAAPQLTRLEVARLALQAVEAQQQFVSWQVLVVREVLDVSLCMGLPLGALQPQEAPTITNALNGGGDGTGREMATAAGNAARNAASIGKGPGKPLEIRIVSGVLEVSAASCVEQAITRFSQCRGPKPRRGVRIVGSGADGGGFIWDSRGWNKDDDTWEEVDALNHVLQLSRWPVRRLEWVNWEELPVRPLVQGLRALPSLDSLTLRPRRWYLLRYSLLSRLPLHVKRVRLLMARWSSSGDSDDEHESVHGQCAATLEVFELMLAQASHLQRTSGPLVVHVPGVGPGSRLWAQVDEWHAEGRCGVVLQELWDS